MSSSIQIVRLIVSIRTVRTAQEKLCPSLLHEVDLSELSAEVRKSGNKDLECLQLNTRVKKTNQSTSQLRTML